MLISSGFSFDGYKIVKYSGYISGDDATQIPRSGVFGGKNGENLTEALVKIRRRALIELKEAAYNLGCNAVVGVDFDYITLEPETANFGGPRKFITDLFDPVAGFQRRGVGYPSSKKAVGSIHWSLQVTLKWR